MIRAKNRTPAALAANRPRPAPVYTDEQQLDRLRTGLVVTLGARWSLSRTVHLICEPLALRITAAPNAGRFLRRVSTPPTSHLINYPRGEAPGVEEVADAVHALVHVAVGLVAERDARRKTAHLSGDTRSRSIRAVVDLTARPAAPEVAREDVAVGTWPALLIALAEPYSERLSDLLGNAQTPEPSDRVLAALRDADRTARSLARRLDRDEAVRAHRTAAHAKPKATTPTDADRRAELAALGVEI